MIHSEMIQNPDSKPLHSSSLCYFTDLAHNGFILINLEKKLLNVKKKTPKKPHIKIDVISMHLIFLVLKITQVNRERGRTAF